MSKLRRNDHSHRKRMEALCHRCYLPYKPPGFWHQGIACCYCSWLADTLDHVPPIVWLYSLGSEYFEKKRIMLVKVPACRECNSKLRDQNLFTVKARTQWLAERYRQKYIKLLYGRPWSDREIERLFTGTLKREITCWSNLQHAIHRRIAIIEENAALR